MQMEKKDVGFCRKLSRGRESVLLAGSAGGKEGGKYVFGAYSQNSFSGCVAQL